MTDQHGSDGPVAPSWGGTPDWGQAQPPTWGNAPHQMPPGQLPPVPPPQGQFPGQFPGQYWVPKPGIIPLRPLAVGEILDGSFQAIRTNPRTMLGFSALVALVVAVVGLAPNAYWLKAQSELAQATTDTEPTTDELISSFSSIGGVLATSLLRTIATLALSAILAVAIGEAVIGRRMDIRALAQRVKPRAWGVIGVALLSGLLPSVVLVAIGAALGFSLYFAYNAVGIAATVAIGVVLVVLLAIAATYISVKISLTGAAFALEGLSPINAMRRSWHLSKGSWWRLFGIQLLVSLIVSVASSVLSGPAVFIGSLLGSTSTGTGRAFGGALLMAIGQVIASTVITPFAATATTLLYIDRRMRSEGLDVQLVQASSSGQAA